MSEFKVHILGCGSASPSLRHNPSCQVVEWRGRLFVMDCGEGAQLEMRRRGLPMSRITDIFISHLHGDHILGLPGLLATLALHEKGGTVTVHTFREGAELVRHAVDICSHNLSYDLQFDIIPRQGGLVYEDNGLTVTAFPLHHRVPCVGFRFDEKPKQRHMRGDMLKFHQVPVAQIAAIRSGADFCKPDGTVIPNAMLTLPPSPSYSYAYCADTLYKPSTAGFLKGVTTLYHEATYGDDLADTARNRFHSTPSQAAATARDAGVSRLILGHFSNRYTDTAPLVDEARAIFPNTVAADEGMIFEIDKSL